MIGEAVPRLEDERFLRGQGRFVDDIALPQMAFGHVLRSPHAHARIVRIDKAAAERAPGVLAVFTGEDLARDGVEGLPCKIFPQVKGHRPVQPVLVSDKVRHVGDRMAFIVAETPAAAKDAADLVEVEYEELGAVTLEDALAAAVWDEAQSNVSFELQYGDRQAVRQAFAGAAHITRLRVHYPRAAPSTIEPRAVLAYRDPADGRYTLCSGAQAPFRVREILSAALNIPELGLRVIAPDVGGAFGMKGQVYPEEALVVWAAGKLGRPVKCTCERSEAMSSDMHGRHQITEAELALNSEGRIVGLKAVTAIDVGAYLGYSGGVSPINAGTSYTNTYDIPLIHAVVRATFTNSCAIGPYRGSGKPEATYVIERLVEQAGREMGIDPLEIRRRNFIRPSAMPYRTPGGFVYDSGEFDRVLDKALELADWKGFEKRRQESRARGLLRGIGLAMHCQPAGHQSERMEIRVAPDGSAALHVGTVSTGQGHETMFAQMVSQWLGLPLEKVRFFQGDTDKILFGRGTFAQRSMSAGGSALKLAADEVIEKGKRLAAWILETSEGDVEFTHGSFRVKGTDRALPFAEVAKKSYAAGLPPELGFGLDGAGTHPGPNSFPNGCMIAEVEVDRETGTVKVARLSAVDDVGTVVNPLTLEGQLHGSIGQGLGQALLEEVVYERGSGQLLTGTFMDYAMPRADDFPRIESGLLNLPTRTNLLGVKGGSEAGNVGAPPAIVHAIIDALGVADVPLPATPERIWQLIRSKRNTSCAS